MFVDGLIFILFTKKIILIDSIILMMIIRFKIYKNTFPASQI
jgi:hypothetical protein